MASVEALTVYLAGVISKNDVGAGPRYPELINAWSSRTASLYRFRVGASPDCDVVIKVLPTPEEALSLFYTIGETSDALEKYASEVSAPFQPLGVSAELKAVIMPYISGAGLNHVLQRDLWGSRDAEDRALKLVAGSGRCLAAYHTKFEDTRRIRIGQAWQHLEGRISTVVGSKGFARNLTDHLPIARSYGDFHPGHIMLTQTGKLALLDPPLEERYTFVHRDMAWFLDALYMLLLHRSVRLRRPFKLQFYDFLAKGFLAGYATGSGREISTLDRMVLSGFEAFLLRRRLRKLWTGRDAAHRIYYGIPVWYRYLRLKRTLLRLLESTRSEQC